MPTSVASASSCAQARGSAISAALLRRSGCRSPIRAISTPRRSPAPCRPARMARGIGLGCLSSQAVGMRLVQPDGSVFEVDADRDPETMAAAQVSIGMLGVISTITLQAVSAYNLKETLWREDFESCMERHDDLAANNRHFSFFWYPVAESRRLYCRRTSKCGPQIRPVISCRMAVVCKVRSNLNVEPLSCLVPCIGADGACSGVPTKLCVIIHNFAQQLFNQLLADRTVLTARQFCHRLCNCCNHLIGIDRVWLAGCRGILSIKVVDQFDHLAMKAGSFL